MSKEPAVILGVLAAVVVAFLQGVTNGDVNSVHDFLLIAAPIVSAAITRYFVTPAA